MRDGGRDVRCSNAHDPGPCAPLRACVLGVAASEIVISTLREKEIALLIEWNYLMAEKDRLLRQSKGLKVAPPPVAVPPVDAAKPSFQSPRGSRF